MARLTRLEKPSNLRQAPKVGARVPKDLHDFLELSTEGSLSLRGLPLNGGPTLRPLGDFYIRDMIDGGVDRQDDVEILRYIAGNGVRNYFRSPGQFGSGVRARPRNVRFRFHGYDTKAIPNSVSPQNITVNPRLGYIRPLNYDEFTTTAAASATDDAITQAAIFAYWTSSATSPTFRRPVTALVGTPVEGKQGVGQIVITVPAMIGAETGTLHLYSTPHEGLVKGYYESPEGEATLNNLIGQWSFYELATTDVRMANQPLGFNLDFEVISGQAVALRASIPRGAIRWSNASQVLIPTLHLDLPESEAIRAQMRDVARQRVVGR